jgi:hypothetical protein
MFIFTSAATTRFSKNNAKDFPLELEPQMMCLIFSISRFTSCYNIQEPELHHFSFLWSELVALLQ